MGHNSVSDEHYFEHKCWDLFKLRRLSSELDVIEPIFYFRLRSGPQVVADELRVERTEKVQGPDDPVRCLLGGFLLFLQSKKSIYFLHISYIFRVERTIYYMIKSVIKIAVKESKNLSTNLFQPVTVNYLFRFHCQGWGFFKVPELANNHILVFYQDLLWFVTHTRIESVIPKIFFDLTTLIFCPSWVKMTFGSIKFVTGFHFSAKLKRGRDSEKFGNIFPGSVWYLYSSARPRESQVLMWKISAKCTGDLLRWQLVLCEAAVLSHCNSLLILVHLQTFYLDREKTTFSKFKTKQVLKFKQKAVEWNSYNLLRINLKEGVSQILSVKLHSIT